MIKNFILSWALLVISQGTFAKVQHLNLGPGKVIAYEYLQNSAEGPTLILLPGVNRALNLEDRSVQLLQEQGWNLLMPSLSAHPLSIEGLASSEIPYFVRSTAERSQDFANEIDQLVTTLKIKNAIPVTLSYSSSVGAYLNPQRYPHVIETVPLGTATEADPDSAKSAELWENWLKLNPFLAPFWIRQFRDTAYSTHWSKVVDANLQSDSEFYGKNPRVSDIKAGYVAIARAVEDFNFPEWDFKKDSRTRDFVIAEKENPERLKNQITVIEHYIASGKPLRVIVVANAGHILPSDRPGVYSAVICLLAHQERQGKVQFAFVKSAENISSLQWQDRKALEAWIQSTQK